MENCHKWAKDYMKHKFTKVLFTDKTHATLDGPDGWGKGLVANGCVSLSCLWCQQGGGIIIWAGYIDGIIVGPWRVPIRVKITAETNMIFLKEHVNPWLK